MKVEGRIEDIELILKYDLKRAVEDEELYKAGVELARKNWKPYKSRDGAIELYARTFEYREIPFTIRVLRYYSLNDPDSKLLGCIDLYCVLSTPLPTEDEISEILFDLGYEGEYGWLCSDTVWEEFCGVPIEKHFEKMYLRAIHDIDFLYKSMSLWRPRNLLRIKTTLKLRKLLKEGLEEMQKGGTTSDSLPPNTLDIVRPSILDKYECRPLKNALFIEVFSADYEDPDNDVYFVEWYCDLCGKWSLRHFERIVGRSNLRRFIEEYSKRAVPGPFNTTIDLTHHKIKKEGDERC